MEDQVKEDDNKGFVPPPEGSVSPPNTQHAHIVLCKKLDQALEEALGKEPQPSTSGKQQGGGDREPATPPGLSAHPIADIQLTSEKWHLEPNKVRFLDEPDTCKANVGRHRVAPLKLLRAKTFLHLVFADSPASPDREEDAQRPRQQRAATSPSRDPP